MERDNGTTAANAAAQNNKYYIEIYLEKTKTKTEYRKKELKEKNTRQKQSRFAFLRHTPKK